MPTLEGHHGRPYLVIEPSRVYAAPSTLSLIVADQPRAHIVYADPTENADWLHVHELGVGVYPDRFQHLDFGQVKVAGGRFVYPKDLQDAGFYKRVDGYIRASAVSPFDGTQDIRLPPSVPVPQLWAKAGIDDPRQFPVDPTADPFGAVVVIVTEFADTKTGKAVRGICSGFLIEDRSTVGTAGHCFSKGTEEGFSRGPIIVGLASASGGTTWGAARLTAWANSETAVSSFDGVANGRGQDWAILKLDESASGAHEPLRLPTPGRWTAAASISVAMVGFGVDLERAVRKEYPRQNIVSVGLLSKLKTALSASDTFMKSVEGDLKQPKRLHWSSCNLNVSEAQLRQAQGDAYLQLRKPPSGCVEGPGDSGGPVVFWNAEAAQYQVIGIISSGHDCKPPLDRSATQLYDRVVADNRRVYGAAEAGSSGKVENGVYAFRAALTPFCAAVSGDASDFTYRHLLDEPFVDAVHAAVGRPGYSLAAIVDGPTAIQNTQWIQPRTLLDKDYILEALRARVLRDRLDTLNPKYQIPTTLGEIFYFNQLAHTPFELLVHVRIGMFRHFFAPVREKELFRQLIADQHTAEPQGDEAKADEKGLEQAFDVDNRYVVAGGDMFQITWPGRLVVGVFRHLAAEPEGTPRYDSRKDPLPQNDLPAPDVLTANLNGPSPTHIPGGALVTPAMAWEMIAGRQGPKPVVVSAVDSTLAIPTAYTMEFAAGPGTFEDAVQNKLAATMGRIGATPDRPIIVYCHHEQCWMSYNLALRLIHLGYRRVFWLRSGWQGWLGEGYLPITWSTAVPVDPGH